MAVLLGAPYNQFLDDDGNPLTGGFVYTYAAGTDTPKDSYTDYTGSTPASNPVELDAAGRADIWIEGDYKITVADSDDVVIRTVDHIEAIDQGGDMQKATYDPANIQQQLVGTTAVQTVSNKTLTSAGSVTFASGSTGGLIGTTTNDNAAAGSVGEYVESVIAIGSATSLTTTVIKDITSISLTAGDWDVSGNVGILPASTMTNITGWTNTTSATNPNSPNAGGYFQMQIAFGSGAGQVFPLGTRRYSLSAPATVYLTTQCTFASTATAYGAIRARRVR